MTSVVSNRQVVQASVLLVFALACGLMLGCGARTSGQPSVGTTTSSGTPAPSEGESPVPEGLPEPELLPGESEGVPPEVEQPPGETEEALGQPDEAPSETEEAPGETEAAPGEAEQPPGETEEAPGETEKVPGEAPPPGETPDGSADTQQKSDPNSVPTVVWLPDPVGVPESKAEKEADMKPYVEKIPGADATFDVTFDMVPIRGGKFMMGSPDDEKQRNDDEGPQHEVAIEPFWMGKCEVTWEEYALWGLGLDKQRRQVLGIKATDLDKSADAITQPTPPYSDMAFSMGKSGRPAICMSQLAAKGYCRWLSAKTGRYYRLPTEAEWEYACRAGTTTAYSFGDDPDKLDEYAWHFDNADDKYHKVGQKKPNPWGLHDMHGNVSEWVLDQHIPDFYKQFSGRTTPNPLAVPAKRYPRVARGGCWDDDPDALRSAARIASRVEWKTEDPQIPQSIWYFTEIYCPGFRVVRPLRMPTPEEAKAYDWDDFDTKEIREYQEAQGGKQ
ncbi:MAG: formylglycine-generating enzyme family protein [Planctomycetota bacterium]|jgi:formylglycine-generating enzyme required for sulfatase activity